METGGRFYTDHLIVLYRKNDLGRPRFGFVISKKFSKRAVDRNRTRRVIKEALRLYGEDLNKLGYDIILVPKKGILGKKTWEIAPDIKTIGQLLEKNAEKSGS
ncbi:MAG: ribonuclease P protein component [Aquificae bacterium]|nr:ribonuclease P protein component [Aquificota bacterium]